MTARFCSQRSSQRGNSIIMVVIAMGLSALLTLNLADLFVGAAKNQRSVTQSMAAEEDTSLLYVVLSRPESCSQALLKNSAGALIANRNQSALDSGKIDIDEIRVPQASGGSSLFMGKQTLAECAAANKLCVESISLVPKRDAAGTIVGNISSTFSVGMVQITYKKTGSTSGAQQIVRTVPVGLTKDAATQRFTSCQSAGAIAEADPKPTPPLRRCSPSIYSDRPWMKETIYCKTGSGRIAVFNFAGDSLYDASGKVIYTSPHGMTPARIEYSSTTGAYLEYGGSKEYDVEGCIKRNLKDIAEDENNTCVK